MPDEVAQPTAVTRFETQKELSDEAPTRLYEEPEKPRGTPNFALLGFIALGLLSLVGFFGSRFTATPDKGREVELKPVVSEKAEPAGRSLQSKEAEVAELPAAESTAPAVTKGGVSKKTQPDRKTRAERGLPNRNQSPRSS